MIRKPICILVLGLSSLAGSTSCPLLAPSCDRWNTEEFFRAANVESVAACLDAGADPMAREPDDRRTPLHRAARASNNPEVIDVLLTAGAEVNVRSQSGTTPLDDAVRFGGGSQLSVIEALLAAGADPNVGDSTSWTLLHQAAYDAQDAELIMALIGAGADLEARTMAMPHSLVGGMTPLHLAVLNGADPAAIEALLAAGADANARNDSDFTPLHMVRLHGAKERVAPMLLAAGADPDSRGSGGGTPLHSAAATPPHRGWRFQWPVNHSALVELLLEAGAEVNARDNDGETPLHEAARYGGPRVVRALLAAGADVNARDNDGETPLHEAARYGGPRVVRALLAARADVNVRTDDGTPLKRAMVNKNLEVIRVLLLALRATESR